jgi:hypothetical protein
LIDPTILPLPFWQYPQGDVVLIYSEAECSVYFACWASSGEPADFIGHLAFGHASAVRSFSREFLPYRIPPHSGHSFILQIPDSEFVREHFAYRQKHYPQFPGKEKRHFVVVGHDIYHEILATEFSARTIAKQDVTDSRLIRLMAAS